MESAYYRVIVIIVSAGRAREGGSAAGFDDFTEDEIKRDYTVGEFPLLLETTPNLHSYSDAGTPLGYSYMKIRGFDDKRISTYINGVPLNDPEDQATYFVDLPDFAANVSDIQVQRGVGNALYGDAAFGGSVNIVTNPFGQERKAVFTAGYGEYTSGGNSVSDVYKQSVEYCSGLVDGRWLYSGRFSKQKSGGYRVNSWYEGWSYYFSVARLDPNMTTELHVYGGPMRMHLAYYGASLDKLNENRRYNPLEYDNETDNFNQPHYQLHNVYYIDDDKTLFNTLYYIRGKGYYEQFKDDRDYFEYDLTAFSDSAGGDVVRQQWVEKNQVGWNPRLDIKHDRGKHSLGGSLYYFESDHWGQVVWAQYINTDPNPRRRYYQYYGEKWQGSLFGQEHYRITDQLSTQLTAQFRYQRYDFDQVRMGAFNGYDYDLDWFFFSPRAGLNYAVNDHLNLYTNFAVSSRTPSDASIYDANDPWILPSINIESIDTTSIPGDTIIQFGDSTVASERVYDLELGGEYRAGRYALGINLFRMSFYDEIIPYGGLNENTGLPVTINADRSVHAGVELTGAVKPLDFLTLSGNFAFNYNRVKDYVTTLDVYDPAWNYLGRDTIDFADKTIPGFPDYLGNLILDYDKDRIRLTGRLRLVGKQYMELQNLDSLAIDPYLTTSLSASYRVPQVLGVGALVFSVTVDNLFDAEYETSGYGWNYGVAAAPGSLAEWVGGAEYFAAAERSFYGQLALEVY
jgi:iron complex outermembrane receptor protein